MKDSLKVLEAMTELLYAELKRASNGMLVTDRAYKILKEASIDAINLQRKIEDARAYS